MVVDPKVLGKVNLVEANIYYTSVCCAFRMFWPFLRAFVVECECLLLDTRYGGHFTRCSFFSPIIASKKKRIIRLKQLWKWINQQIRPCSGALRHLGEKKGRIKRLEKALERKIMTIKRTINKEWSMSINLEDVPTLSESVTKSPSAKKLKKDWGPKIVFRYSKLVNSSPTFKSPIYSNEIQELRYVGLEFLGLKLSN